MPDFYALLAEFESEERPFYPHHQTHDELRTACEEDACWRAYLMTQRDGIFDIPDSIDFCNTEDDEDFEEIDDDSYFESDDISDYVDDDKDLETINIRGRSWRRRQNWLHNRKVFSWKKEKLQKEMIEWMFCGGKRPMTKSEKRHLKMSKSVQYLRRS